MADIFDVLADPTRRELLQALLESRLTPAAGELAVSELVGLLGVSQPTVSKHLKVLREHGLVTARDDAQRRFYSLEAAPLAEMEEWLLPFVHAEESTAGVDTDGPGVAVYAAWAGSNVGSSVGRVAADTAFRARAVVSGAQQRVDAARDRLPERWRREH